MVLEPTRFPVANGVPVDEHRDRDRGWIGGATSSEYSRLCSRGRGDRRYCWTGADVDRLVERVRRLGR